MQFVDTVKSAAETLARMHAGVTAVTPPKLDFSRADQKSYEEVMRLFSKFVWGARKAFCFYSRTLYSFDWRLDEYRNGGPAPDGTGSEPATTTQSPAPTMPQPVVPTNGMLTTNDMAATALVMPVVPAVPTDTFSDAEVQAHIRAGAADFDEFDFPEELMPGPVNLNAGLGLVLDPYSTGFAGALSSDLLLRLEEMTSEAREAKVVELKGMTVDDLERENNAARNYYMLNSLGLSNTQKETLWGGAIAPPVKRKPPTQGKRKGKKARKELAALENETEGEDSDEGTEPEDTQTGAQASRQPTRQKQGVVGKAAHGTMGWEKTVRSFLGNKEYGEDWTALLALWWKREEAVGFEGTVSTKPYKHRPGSADDVNAGRPSRIQRRYDPRRWGTGWEERAITRCKSRIWRISARVSGRGGWKLTQAGAQRNVQ